MDRRMTLGNIWHRMTSVPDDVPREYARYYVYWRFFYAMAGLDHVLVLLSFLQSHVYLMAVVNVFSVGMFAAALFCLKARQYQAAYWLAIAELVMHGILATLSVGPQFSFTSYTFLVVILAFIQPFYRWYVSVLLAVLTLVSAVLVTSYGLDHPPLYAMSEEWSRSMMIRQLVAWPISVLIMVLPFIYASARAEAAISAAYAESNRLLLNILPKSVARRLKTAPVMIADKRDDVCILFADIVDFTAMSSKLPPSEVVTFLNDVFNAIDELVAKHGLEKIKTIGDTYMVAAGLPDSIDDPAGKIARLSLDIVDVVQNFRRPGTSEPVEVRVGINAGQVVAGVIGTRKFAYDLWGDAVNVAARMEQTSKPGAIQVTDEFASLLRDRFDFTESGEVELKGKGRVHTRYLVRERSTDFGG